MKLNLKMAALWLTGLCALGTSLLISLSLNTWAEDGTWKKLLADQLRAEKGCDVKSIEDIREFELAGDAVIEARVLCVDGRQFDVGRSKKHLPFRARLCQPVVC